MRVLTGLGEAGARAALAAFGLASDAAERPASALTPGARGPSWPCSRNALADWPGALVPATHDRRLRDALALDRELAL